MKLLSKQRNGTKISYRYDPAKTPLQRLLLSGILSAQKQQELKDVAQALDPLRLFQQLQQVQTALFRCAVEANPFVSPAAGLPLRVFAVEQCTTGVVPATEIIPDPSRGLSALYQEQEKRKRVLGWRRTQKDPFEGAWEQVASWLHVHPERSSGDIFRELQRLSPGRYQPLQLRTLQRGMRKIRAFFLETVQEHWPEEVIHGQASDLISPDQRKQEASEEACSLCSDTLASPVLPAQEKVRERPFTARSGTEESPRGTATCSGDQPVIVPDREQPQAYQSFSLSIGSQGPRKRRVSKTIERAIQDYLQDQRSHNRRPKTVEWHQTALGLFQHYLMSECHLLLLSQITGKEVCDWLEDLRTRPTSRGTLREASTIATYARSVRAFCNWVVRQGYREQTPYTAVTIPKGSTQRIQLIKPDMFEQLLQACGASGESDARVDQAASRNRAVLWVLRETGIGISKMCGLRLGDVDCEQGILTVRGDAKERRMTLSTQGWHSLFSYLEQRHSKETCSVRGQVRGPADEAYLFLLEKDRQLTPNAITLLFCRLRKRTGMSEKGLRPSILRDTFAVEYLQAGGGPEALCEILGLVNVAAVKRYQRVIAQMIENEKRKECGGDHLLQPVPESNGSR